MALNYPGGWFVHSDGAIPNRHIKQFRIGQLDDNTYVVYVDLIIGNGTVPVTPPLSSKQEAFAALISMVTKIEEVEISL